MDIEKAQLVHRVRKAVKAGDCARPLEALEGLRADEWDLSGEELEPGHSLTGAIVELFLSRRDYGLLWAAMPLEVLDDGDVSRVLDEHAQELPTGFLLDYVEAEGLLGTESDEEEGELADVRERKGIDGELARRPDETITKRLVAEVRRLAADQRKAGRAFSRHPRTTSAFRIVRVGLLDAYVAPLLEILAARGGVRVQQLFLKLSRTLPWGEDRAATLALLGLMGQMPVPAWHRAIRNGLEHHAPLTPAREAFLIGLSQFDRRAALRQAVEDLRADGTPEERIVWQDFIAGMLKTLAGDEGSDKNDALEAHVFESVDVRPWDRVSRGMWARCLARLRPDVAVRGASWLDRFLVRLFRAFGRWRLNRMGCACSVPLFVGAYVLLTLGLDYAFGGPSGWLWVARLAVFVVWLVVLLATMSSRSYPLERVRQQLRMAIVFWLTTVIALLTIPGVSLYAYLAR